MRLWTFQPLHIYKIIQETGVYRCNQELCGMLEYSEKGYKWLSRRMTEKIGPPPDGVIYPVWAWYLEYGKNEKPDLRKERWSYGNGNEKYVCMELEIPADKVVLTDFDKWLCILGNSIISNSEEEDDLLRHYSINLPENEWLEYQYKNWERVFDINPEHDCWISDYNWIQATFWELMKKIYER